MFRQRFAQFVFLLLLPVASQGATPERAHIVDAEDYFSLAVVGDVAVAPDARHAVFTETRWNPPEESRNTDLWIVEVNCRQSKRLTFDNASDSSPHWSPDSRYIYFASSRKLGDGDAPPYNGKKQVWRVPAEGGEPFAVTRLKDGIDLFDLSRDGNTLYYTVTEEHIDPDWKDLKKEYGKLTYGHGVNKVGQLWKLDLQSWRAEKLIDDQRVIRQIAVSPDQRRVAMLTTPEDVLLSNEGWSRVDVYDAETGEVEPANPDGWRAGHPTPYGWIDAVTWSDDSRALAFTISFDGYPPMLYVIEWNGDNATQYELRRPDIVTIAGGTAKWRGQGRELCFLGEYKARERVYCISDVAGGKQSGTQFITPEDGVVGAFDFTPRGDQLAFVMGTSTHTPDVYWRQPAGAFDRLTNVNPQVDTWKLPQISIVSWTAPDGKTVEGILELPPDHKPGTPLPMVVEIHGGPTSATTVNMRFWIYGRTLLPSKGYALLSPNYRGSTGYGDEFMTDLIGHENDIEVKDILAGVDAMVERGVADPDRLGVMGWSNGGFLTNCLITKSTRFKAASSGAGVLDMTIQWGTEDTPGHVINYMQGLLWDVPDAYRKASPIYDLDKVTTPTLIHVGENDERVPAANARALHRGLHYYRHVPTELVVYPGEGHGLTKYSHRKAKMKWDLAWFDHYILGKSDEGSAPASTD
ncbi:MAG: S9 family peptidase [Phycisphaerae bacterium]|nr:S9 family peptidase [Phycisphaerae bacterium]